MSVTDKLLFLESSVRKWVINHRWQFCIFPANLTRKSTIIWFSSDKMFIQYSLAWYIGGLSFLCYCLKLVLNLLLCNYHLSGLNPKFQQDISCRASSLMVTAYFGKYFQSVYGKFFCTITTICFVILICFCRSVIAYGTIISHEPGSLSFMTIRTDRP